MAVELTNENRNRYAKERSIVTLEVGQKGSAGWPRLRRPSQAIPYSKSAGTAAGGAANLSVLLVGKICLDIVLEIDATLAETAAWLTGQTEKLRREWRIASSTLGGFVVHAARAAHALGCQVHIAADLPLPLPDMYDAFLDEIDADTQYCLAIGGPTPTSIILACQDGHRLLCRDGFARHHTPLLPERILEEFDAVVAGPGPTEIRMQSLRMLSSHNSSRRAILGLIASSDWTAKDLEVVRGTGAWLYANEGETRTMARTLIGGIDSVTLPDAAQQLKRLLASEDRVVTTAGECGAYLLNGSPDMIHVTSMPVHGAQRAGSGDILAVTTTVSSATGAPEEVSLARGVRAGHRHVAGLPLAKSWQELDRTWPLESWQQANDAPEEDAGMPHEIQGM